MQNFKQLDRLRYYVWGWEERQETGCTDRREPQVLNAFV